MPQDALAGRHSAVVHKGSKRLLAGALVDYKFGFRLDFMGQGRLLPQPMSALHDGPGTMATGPSLISNDCGNAA